MIGHLGHFLLDFYGQIWTQGTLRHILGPILVIFEICHFLTIPGPFEYFSENGWSQKIVFYTTQPLNELRIYLLTIIKYLQLKQCQACGLEKLAPEGAVK